MYQAPVEVGELQKIKIKIRYSIFGVSFHFYYYHHVFVALKKKKNFHIQGNIYYKL